MYKCFSSLQDFFGLDDEDQPYDQVDGAIQFPNRHTSKWESRLNALASNAFVSTLDHVKKKEKDQVDGSLEMGERRDGEYQKLRLGERPLPTENIDTSKPGRRTQLNRDPLRAQQNSAFDLTYQYYQDWMVN